MHDDDLHLDPSRLRAPDDLSGLVDLEAVPTPLFDLEPTPCSTAGCEGTTTSTGGLCGPCLTAATEARQTSPSPRLSRPPGRLGLDELLARSAALAGRVTEDAEPEMRNHARDLQEFCRETGAGTRLDDSDVWVLTDLAEIRAYALDLLDRYGLPLPEPNGPTPTVDIDDRINRGTWDRRFHLLDRWHMRHNVAPPWRTLAEHPSGGLFVRDLRAAYLKAHSGQARDPLELDVLFRLLIGLGRPDPHQLNTAALIAAATHPDVALDGTRVADGARIPLNLWRDLEVHQVRDDGVTIRATVRSNRLIREVLVPPGPAAHVRALLDLRRGGATEGPLFRNANGQLFGPNGVPTSLRNAIGTHSHTLPAWQAGRGIIRMPKPGEGEVLIDRVLRLPDEALRDAAWLANAFWTASRGGETLNRTVRDAVPSAAGILWRLPRKPDKVGRRTPYLAPHLRWREVDPANLLLRWRDRLAALWRGQGHDPDRFGPDCRLFPTDLNDVTAVPADVIRRFNRRIAGYQTRFAFLPDYLNLGTHSLRSGLVTSGRTLGIPDPSLMQQGGWHDVTVFHSYFATIRPGSASHATTLMVAAFDPDAPVTGGLGERIAGILAGLDDTCGCLVCTELTYPVADIEEVIRSNGLDRPTD